MKRGALELFKQIDFSDILIIAGLGFFFGGLYIYEPWVALTVTGAVLLALGLRKSGS